MPRAAASSTPAPSRTDSPTGSPRTTSPCTSPSTPGRGFTGGLNWYRNQDRSWALTGAWRDAPVALPAAFAAGEHDLVVAGVGFDAVVATMRRRVPDLRATRLLPGCGHWTQQERPAEITALISDFARWTDRNQVGSIRTIRRALILLTGADGNREPSPAPVHYSPSTRNTG